MRQARDLYVKRDVPVFLQKGVEPLAPSVCEGVKRQDDDASNARRRNRPRGGFAKASGLSQVLKSFDGRSTSTASRKTWVIWNCVHHAKKHLRGTMMV